MATTNIPPGVHSGPIAPTMLRLALPTIIVLAVQTLVGVAETYFVSFLGTDATEAGRSVVSEKRQKRASAGRRGH